ncbi:MAG TPA: pyruvate formate lyase family protein [Myxococcota bacterium]|nr:pyruvate formate lyase family protein [Myxococcota bacterium]
MPAVSTAKNWISSRLTPALVTTKLRGLALMLNHRPAFRHHLTDTHPVGVPFSFEARFLFTLDNGATAAHAIFEGGKMKVGSGPIDKADLTVRFRGLDVMRTFFTAGADTLGMLLDNSLSFEGNLSYLLKFGHMSTAVNLGNRPARPEAPWSATHGPADWRDLEAPAAGEPCPERPSGETTHLDDPYLAGYTLDDFPKAKKLLWAFRTVQPEICSERARLLTEFMLKQRTNGGGSDAVVLRQGKALEYMLERKLAIIHPDDLLAGTTTSKRIGVVVYPETGGVGIWPELLTVEARRLNPYRISAEDIAILDRQVFPFWMEDNIRDYAKRTNGNPRALLLDEKFVLYFMWKTQAVSHTVADMPQVLSRGLLDIRADATEREQACDDDAKRAFYQGVCHTLDGVIDYARRLALAAGLQADKESDTERKQTLIEMAQSLERVPAHPARDLRDALQAAWVVFLCEHLENMNAGLSIGRLDTWFEPYLQRSLAGATDAEDLRKRVEQAIELTCAYLLKHTDHLPLVPDLGNRLFGGSSSDQVITLGGQKPDGSSAVCDMTWIFLKAVEMLRLRDPNINARFAPEINSQAFLRRLCEVNLLTHATPSLHNDAAVLPALVAQGFPIQDARDYSATGCVEPTVCGKHFGHTNSMMFNMVAPLEMALNRGVHPLLGERVGPETPDPRAMKSYEEFREAYLQQLGKMIDLSVEANNMLGRAHQALKPTPFLSAIFQGPLDKGRDLIDGGAIYNSSGTAMIGLTDVIDSLAAVKTLVFERGEFDMSTLLDALRADFEGFDNIRARILNKAPKFGQDEELPGEIARELQDFIFERFQAHQNYRGGRYLPGYWSMSNHVAFGLLSGALPSGRLRGKAFTPGLTPSHLAQAPLTSQIRCVAALDNVKMPNNIAFNVKVVPGAEDSHRAVLDRMSAYVSSYFELGGMQMQFNVTSTATLKDAIENPEAYRDLMVRISGYNAYFVELNSDIQNEIIERMEHVL